MAREDYERIRNLDHTAAFEVRSIDIAQWHPLPNGEGKPTQVHMVMDVAAIPFPMVFRFKGTETLDEVIRALCKHRDEVFGKGPYGKR